MAAMNPISDWGQVVADAVEKMIEARRCHPLATYRLQFAKDRLTFRDAAAIVPYLDELGISHVYASPYLKTRSGSTQRLCHSGLWTIESGIGRREQTTGRLSKLYTPARWGKLSISCRTT